MATSGSISPFSFSSLPIQFPVRKVKSGKLWWTAPLVEESRTVRTRPVPPVTTGGPSAAPPDGDHLPLDDGRVQLPHAADVPRPLELLRVDEEDGLLHPREELVVERQHPGVQRHAAPEGRRVQAARLGHLTRRVHAAPERRGSTYLNLTSLPRASITVAPPKECPTAATRHRSMEFCWRGEEMTSMEGLQHEPWISPPRIKDSNTLNFNPSAHTATAQRIGVRIGPRRTSWYFLAYCM